MSLNPLGNYVYPGLTHPSSYSLQANAMAQQPASVYPNSHLLYYPVTTSVYSGIPPLYQPQRPYSSPTFLSYLKAIADQIQASDARAKTNRNAGTSYANQWPSPKITPPVVRKPVHEALEELGPRGYCEDKGASSTSAPIFPAPFLSTIKHDWSMVSPPKESDVNSSDDSEEDDINVVDVDEEHSVPSKSSDYFLSPELTSNKFVEDRRFEPSPTSTSRILSEYTLTPPQSDSEQERNTDIYQKGVPLLGSTKTQQAEQPNTRIPQAFGQPPRKSLDKIGRKPKLKRRFSQSTLSFVEVDSAKMPPRPTSAPVRSRHRLPETVIRPIRPRSAPNLTLVFRKRLKQMRTAKPTANPQGSSQKPVITRTEVQTRDQCGGRDDSYDSPKEQSPFQTHTPVRPTASHAKRELAFELPQPSAFLRTSAASTLPLSGLYSIPALANSTTETLGTNTDSKEPQACLSTGATAASPLSWPWLGLLSERRSYAPQATPYSIGAFLNTLGTRTDSTSVYTPRTRSWALAALELLAQSVGKSKSTGTFPTQTTTGQAAPFATGAPLVHGVPQSAAFGTTAATGATSTWQHWQQTHTPSFGMQSFSGSARGTHSSGTPLVFDASKAHVMTSAEWTPTQTETTTQTAQNYMSATNPLKHDATKEFQVFPLDQTPGVSSSSLAKTPLHKNPSSKRKCESPESEAFPKHHKPLKSVQIPPQREHPHEEQATYPKSSEFMCIGSRGTLVRRDLYDMILWENYVQSTKLLMQFIFNFHSMATLTVDGPGGLDPDTVHDISTHVASKCGVPVNHVLTTMRHICSVTKLCFEESNFT